MSVGRADFASFDSASDRGDGGLDSRESWRSWVGKWSRGARPVGGENIPGRIERNENQLAKSSLEE